MYICIFSKIAKTDSTGKHVIVQAHVDTAYLTTFVTKKQDTAQEDVNLIFWVRCVKVSLNKLYYYDVHVRNKG